MKKARKLSNKLNDKQKAILRQWTKEGEQPNEQDKKAD